MLKKFVNFQIPNSGVQCPWLHIRITDIQNTVNSRVITVGHYIDETYPEDQYFNEKKYEFYDMTTDPYNLLLTHEDFEGFEKI